MPGSKSRKSAFAVATIAGVVVVIVASSGWFYLRNYELYGDISGAAVLFEKFDRQPHGSVFNLIRSRKVWSNFVEQLWGYYSNGIRIRPTTMFVPRLVGLLALLGLAAEAFIQIRAINRASIRNRLRQIVLEPRTLNVAMLVCLTGLVFASIFVFHSGGGNAHARYLFPLLWVLLVLPAIGLLRFDPRVAGFALTLLVVTHLLTIDAYVAKAHAIKGSELSDLLLVSFDRPDWLGSRWLISSLVAVAAGLTVILAYLSPRSSSSETVRSS